MCRKGRSTFISLTAVECVRWTHGIKIERNNLLCEQAPTEVFRSIFAWRVTLKLQKIKLSISILRTSFRGENAQKQCRRLDDNIQTSDKLQEISCNRFVNVLSSNYSNGNVTGNNTDTDSETVTGTYKNYEVTRTNIKER